MINKDNKLPCGFDANRLDCIDCCGYGECEHTKGISIDDKMVNLNDQLIETLKSSGIIDIESIKKYFINN